MTSDEKLLVMHCWTYRFVIDYDRKQSSMIYNDRYTVFENSPLCKDYEDMINESYVRVSAQIWMLVQRVVRDKSNP